MSSRWSSNGSITSQENVRPRKGRHVGYIPPSFRDNSKPLQDTGVAKSSTAPATIIDKPLVPDFVPPHLRVPVHKTTALVEVTENALVQPQAEPTDFVCGHPMCIKKFKTEIRLKEHKYTTHDYCRRCDMDFEDVSHNCTIIPADP